MLALNQSRYLVIPSGEGKVFAVKSGSVEVYACTPKDADADAKSYNKLFLAQLGEGECFFSPAEPLSPLEFQVFARSDCVIDDTDVKELSSQELEAWASEGFHALVELEWIRYLIGLGDEALLKWESKTIFDSDNEKNTAAVRSDNLEILDLFGNE